MKNLIERYGEVHLPNLTKTTAPQRRRARRADTVHQPPHMRLFHLPKVRELAIAARWLTVQKTMRAIFEGFIEDPADRECNDIN